MNIRVKYTGKPQDIFQILSQNRNIGSRDTIFFQPKIEHLHDPGLMPDMEQAVKRVLEARKKGERVVVFGDYDVDGVSGTAILVRFFTEIGIETSYRLPHRVHDGYGLKKYFFDELKEKDVKLVVTVDCGTRDIEAIEYAKSIGIDVIVTDHHAVPEKIPEGVPVLNPKRKDSQYPFPNLAGAGVAFKLVQGILVEIKNLKLKIKIFETFLESGILNLESIAKRYIDFAALGTVSDCMPLTGENRTITTLGLKQMKNSHSHGLRKFLEGKEKMDGNADIIGFQIGPRINAAGRMDTPLTALRWLLASEDRCDEFLEEIEQLNSQRQEVVKSFSEEALTEANPDNGVLFFRHEDLEHGIIGLVAGKLTETYNRPSIVLCNGKPEGGSLKSEETKKREYELKEGKGVQEQDFVSPLGRRGVGGEVLVASCRSPEWCNLVELLDECKEYFVRYGGHRQAAGFTIEASRFEEFQVAINRIFYEKYSLGTLPEKILEVESILDPQQATLETLGIIRSFQPFGIGNPKPLWLLQDVTIASTRNLGAEGKHLSFTIAENPDLRLLLWNAADILEPPFGKSQVCKRSHQVGEIRRIGLGEPSFRKDARGIGDVFGNPLSERGQGGLENTEFHIPHRDDLKEKARELRNNMTQPEKEIWYTILSRDAFNGLRFLRQKPLLDYIVDFYCAELKLAIEIDGESHMSQIEYDKKRTADLASFGVHTLRLTNYDISHNIKGVYEKIKEEVERLKKSHPPYPPSGRGLAVGDVLSLVIELEENEWNGRKSVQGIVREVVE